MEKRIKIIHWLTIIALSSLIAFQMYWLVNQYKYTIQQYENEVLKKTIETGNLDFILRKKQQNNRYKAISQWKMNITQKNTVSDSIQTNWLIDVYIIDTKKISLNSYDSLPQIKSLAKMGKGIKEYRFNVLDTNREFDVYEMIEKFQINILSPFNIQSFDSLLQAQNLRASHIEVDITQSTICKSNKINYSSFWNPTTEITLPLDPLQKKQIRIIYELGGPPILERMFKGLLFSIALSVLLIFCLIYQARTIFKQQRIDELRKSFIKTMIHELKRPVSTLKMCISFMKNDTMMKDKVMKNDIIHSSQNELDNLSSYFSKLRDLTYDDLEEIPLNLSTFSMKLLITECIEKQNTPTDRKVNIALHLDNDNVKMTADKMHISNIICNLLENAIKYSSGETSILVNFSIVKNSYRLEVSDNGSGISPTEHNYIFTKFYRSKSVIEKNIPGIGLGLSYVKLLVTAHKGTISLESILGKGSKFIIEIPRS